ncbi:hypothetical protein V6N13_065054 [Hibiscus sabdariffa]
MGLWYFKALHRRALDRVILALDATFGMECLHSKNIVHFGSKCDNLTGGTLPWMAPELLNDSSIRVSEKVNVRVFDWLSKIKQAPAHDPGH